MKLKIGTLLWHPCSIDIIPHKIIGVRSYEDHTVYESQALGSVGACGKVKVLLYGDSKGVLRYSDMEHTEHSSGLQDFVEGIYYTEQLEARLVFNEQQRILCWSKMEDFRRTYEAAKFQYEKVSTIVEGIKQDIKDSHGK